MKLLQAFCIAYICCSGVANATTTILATIKPLHSIVQNVLGDELKAQLLIDGANVSPHDFQFKPSDVRKVNNTDVVFLISPTLETFLDTDSNKYISVIDSPELKLLEYNEGDHEDEHNHGHDHNDGSVDPHVWLSPKNAVAITQFIAKTLGERDPDNQSLYQTNADAYVQTLLELDKTISQSLETVKDKPFVVHHDAYQYFTHQYGLRQAEALTIHPEQQTSVAQVQKIRNFLKETQATCVFREPQFPDKMLRTIIEGTGTKIGVLDPIGAELEPGKDLYVNLLNALTQNLKECLQD
jgi:zinc transport system substrate-binding protein